MKNYVKPELQVREIRVSENLAAAKSSWGVSKSGNVFVTNYLGLSTLLLNGSEQAAN